MSAKEGYKAHRPGTRKGTIHKLFDEKGREPAMKKGLALDLAKGTIYSWFSEWSGNTGKGTKKKAKSAKRAKVAKGTKRAKVAKGAKRAKVTKSATPRAKVNKPATARAKRNVTPPVENGASA